MMKIVRRKTKNYRLSELKKTDAFLYGDELYLVIEHSDPTQNKSKDITTLLLHTGKIWLFTSDTIVEKASIKVKEL